MRDKYYNEIYLAAASSSDINEDQKLIDIFKHDAPTNKVILDVGCGPGVTLKCITEENKVFGVDIVDEYLKMAKSKGYYQIIKHNLEDGLAFFEKSVFDIVVCTDLIEHVFETELIGREIHRVLKDEGYAILNVRNHNELGHRLRFLSGKGINIHDNFEDWNYAHIRFFTWNSWNEYLTKIGFEVIEFYPVPSRICMPIPQFIRSKLGGTLLQVCLNSQKALRKDTAY